MSSYVGGPYDGKTITTKYDHLPILHIEYTDVEAGKPVRKVASYELRCGMRCYTGSRDYFVKPKVPG